MSEIVRLTYGELTMAAHIGVARQAANLCRGLKNKYGADEIVGGWERHILGCLGELATAKYLNLFWAGSLQDFEAADVGGIVDVRASANPARPLILHPPDKESRPFVRAYVNQATVELEGWILCADGKLPSYWGEGLGGKRPAFFVPQEALRPMPDLITWLERR